MVEVNAELEDRHDDMVRRLVKPAQDILFKTPSGFSDWLECDKNTFFVSRSQTIEQLDFTPQLVNIMHACIGLGGEPGELAALLTVSGDEQLTNGVIEETGDIYFYARALRQELGSVYVPISLEDTLRLVTKHYPEADFSGFDHSENAALVYSYLILNMGVGITIDAMKRVFIYGGNLDTKLKALPEVSLREAAIDGLQIIEHALGIMLRHVDRTRDDSLHANWFKLEGQKDARYKEGYSDAAALARADKPNPDDDFDDTPMTGGACNLGETCESCQ